MTRFIAVTCLCVLVAGCSKKGDATSKQETKTVQQSQIPTARIQLPPGFRIDVYAKDVKDARSMARSPNGTLFVGTRDEGKVYALIDSNKDNVVDKVFTLATGLNTPNGIAFVDGDLYVAEIHRIVKFADVEAHLEKPATPTIVYDKLPTESSHGWRYIGFGPDGLLYVASGAPCNVCERKDEPRFATILRMKKDGSNVEIFAKGVRNSVGFDWEPKSNELWFTENGRDLLGDDVPPDELNHAPKIGMNFGFPFCHGGFLLDPDLGSKRKCSEFVAPAMNLGAHVAALGMRFYRGSMFPAKYKNQIFIAEHGSWNRSKKSGYRISLVKVQDNKAIGYETFADGFKQGEESWGRPVDLLEMPDGSMLVSDDQGDAIYRITYNGKSGS